ncbi:dnaK protein [Tritrichomonas foetus]|uniref:DnaK protein n=1 Tax=Tritrichomonas foetus TaxID=1144522 RepID=A0A1J4KHL5_9EUKA|nr:dnaK protein [Tritrichomonas foetus]|eukprot:OHT10699.1 dnaK protein [Tritrichomonas foetus]
MLIITLPFFISSAIFGIDYGSEYIKVSMALPGRGIHTALNQQSKRLSPAYFAMWNISNQSNSQTDEHWSLSNLEEMDWSFLDAAKSHSMRFPANSVKGMTPVMSIRHGLNGREVLALILRHLVKTVDEGQWKPEGANIVMTVEPRLPREERIAIAEAVLLANMTLTAIVDSSTAAAHVYALEKQSLFDEKGKIVTFFDVGATHTWAAVYNFSVANKTAPAVVEELAVDFNYTLGGNLMDKNLADLLMLRFKEQNNVEITSERKKIQILEEARRAKELLTINKQITVKIDDVVDDLGLNYLLTRSEFESLIIDFNQSLRDLFYEVVKKAGLNTSQVDSIELIGGSTRVPFVKHSLMDVSGMIKLNRTMNSDEAIALGAGYIGASRSSSFVIKPIRIRPFAGVNVSLWKDGDYVQELFNETSRTTDFQIVNTTIGNLGNFTITCNNVTQIGFNFTDIPENLTNEDTVEMFFYFDAYTSPTIYGAFCNSTKRLNPHFVTPDWMCNLSQIMNYSYFVRRMEEITHERHFLQQVKNDYESYIYSIQDRLEYDTLFKRVLSDEQTKNLTEVLDSHRNWLFGDHSTINSATDSSTSVNDGGAPNADTYKKRLEELKKVTADAEFRAKQIVKRAPAFNKLNKTLNMVYNALTVTWPESKPWITETFSYSIWLEYNQTLKWFNEIYQHQANLTDYENPVVKYQEIDNKRTHLEQTYNMTDKIPKPTPTPTPTTEVPQTDTSSSPITDSTDGQPTEKQTEKKFIPKSNGRIDSTGYENDEL